MMSYAVTDIRFTALPSMVRAPTHPVYIVTLLFDARSLILILITLESDIESRSLLYFSSRDPS